MRAHGGRGAVDARRLLLPSSGFNESAVGSRDPHEAQREVAALLRIKPKRSWGVFTRGESSAREPSNNKVTHLIIVALCLV